jgi:hypothetical protein
MKMHVLKELLVSPRIAKTSLQNLHMYICIEGCVITNKPPEIRYRGYPYLGRIFIVSTLIRPGLELHAHAQCKSTQHDLLCQNIQHTMLHSCLEITWSCCKVAWDNYEGVIWSAGHLQAEGGGTAG